MENSTKRKELFFNNLLLLGFDKAAAEKEFRTICDKNMFCLPNQKMFEVVTYFLFSKLNSVSGKRYTVPWPLLDREQHREFQKSCFKYLSSIAQESNVKFPRMVPSLLSTFCGDRFYELYFAFSTHVVEQTVRKSANVELVFRPKVSSTNFQNATEILKIETNSSTAKSRDIQHATCIHFKQLLNYSKDFILLIHKLKSNLLVNHSKLKERISTLNSSCCWKPEEIASLEGSIKKTVLYEKKVKRHWTQLGKFLDKEKELWSFLCTEVEGHKKSVLDGASVKVTIPDILEKEHSEELKVVGPVKSDENGQLCLQRFIKLFIIFLESFSRSYQKCDLSKVYSLCNLKEPTNLEECVNDLKCLNDQIMNDVLLNTKESTERLQETLFVKEFSDDLENLIKESPSWSYNSKYFQERIKSTRSNAFLPFSNGSSNSSLFVNESSIDDLKPSLTDLSANILTSTSHNYNDFSTTSSASEASGSMVDELFHHNINKNYVEESIFQNTQLCDTVTEKPGVNDHLYKNEVLDIVNENDQDVNVKSSLPMILDFEIDYSKHFKMRESWSLEDSLNSMTLPDDSLID